MLDELHVRNIALISDASIQLSSGLTVLTGETGAGKTALLSALKLIGGQRADSKAVRDGEQEALAEARYLVDGEEHVVSRKLTAQGRSRCAIDGEMATVAQLSQALSFIQIHNQHEQVKLLQPSAQLEFLDRFISQDNSHLTPYRDALDAYRKASKRYRSLEEASANQEQELEYLKFVDAQISQVNPQEGEYERLEEELPRLQNAESLAVSVQSALDFLSSDSAALDQLSSACGELSRQVGVDKRLDDISQQLDEALGTIEDLTRELRSYREGISYDPAAVQEHLSRLNSLSGLMKRYGPGMDQVFAMWEKAKSSLEGAGASPEVLKRAKKDRDDALKALRVQGEELQALRNKHASRLCEMLAESVAELAMPSASFEFAFEDLNSARWTDAGPGSAELLYRPAEGASARPMRQIASGGELSRILLALECVLRSASGASSDETLVFDEVDAGIGGATGESVGQRLASLAQRAQVIVVTHLPQVACHADAHFVVTKEDAVDGMPSTQVALVTGEERVAEIARMLSGRTDETAMDHARKLLQESGQL